MRGRKIFTRMRAAKLDCEEVLKRCKKGSMYVDVVPIGKWKYKRIDNDCAIVCSECGHIFHRIYNFTDVEDYKRNMQAYLAENHGPLDKFCRDCGADLREGDVK